MSIVRDRTSLTEEAAAELESVLEDSNKTKAVIESAKTSMGLFDCFAYLNTSVAQFLHC